MAHHTAAVYLVWESYVDFLSGMAEVKLISVRTNRDEAVKLVDEIAAERRTAEPVPSAYQLGFRVEKAALNTVSPERELVHTVKVWGNQSQAPAAGG